jgi:hypothetical protein
MGILQSLRASLRVWLFGWPSLKCHRYKELKDKLEFLLLELETILQTEGFETQDNVDDLAGVREMLEKQYSPSAPTFP